MLTAPHAFAVAGLASHFPSRTWNASLVRALELMIPMGPRSLHGCRMQEGWGEVETRFFSNTRGGSACISGNGDGIQSTDGQSGYRKYSKEVERGLFRIFSIDPKLIQLTTSSLILTGASTILDCHRNKTIKSNSGNWDVCRLHRSHPLVPVHPRGHALGLAGNSPAREQCATPEPE